MSLLSSARPAWLRDWPADKFLTLLFPAFILLLALAFGDVSQLQPQENKAALTGAAVFALLIALTRLALRKGWLSDNSEWLLRNLWPVPAMLFGYLLMRLLRLELAIDALGLPLMDAQMLAFDQRLFGQTPAQLLQPLISPALTLWMESAYLHFYYALPIGSLLWLHQRGERAHFVQLRKGILYTLCTGWLLYLLVPVIGPGQWMAQTFSVSLGAQDGLVYDAVNSFRYAYDCFPSLHTAVPWVTLLICWRWYGPGLRLTALLMTLSITLSTLYLRYHYGADMLAGVALAVLVTLSLKRTATGLVSPSRSMPADCA
ncbi:phosphatase PAP2 family protein [Thalassolituus sp. LLYu03]|uniref:phosphatase PAP2 family protein n=1 Tax=Thalassolituus sp. LLYu03 TaxID=3421656 RepID=UPI003D2AF0B8